MAEPTMSDTDETLADHTSPGPRVSQESGRASLAHDEKEWLLKPEVEEFRDQEFRSGAPPRRLGVTWTDLTVRAASADAAIHENILSQFNIPRLVAERRRKRPLKTILDRSHGCVKPGEMLLVLGRPGSGCTTLLSMLANRRRGYTSVTGDVHYGSMDAAEVNMYRGQIVMNTEEELFFPGLTVGQTMDFSTRMKVPKVLPDGVSSPAQYQKQNRDLLLRSMGINHTVHTKVGNEYVRGVSGGERKRVSIIETLATRASVFCWDNATRGLDASSALEYTKAIRAVTDVFGLASVVTLYQAGNGIYSLFDKVLVLDGGRQVYYGPACEARHFMEQLGFVCPDSANVADFLTGVTVPTERAVRPGFEETFPRNATMLQAEYEKSAVFARMVGEYDYPSTAEARRNTDLFRRGVAMEKHEGLLPADSPLMVGFATQVRACVIRQFQIIWGDKPSLVIKQGSTVALGLVAGSLFYNAPGNSVGLFLKGGALFFSLLYNSLLAMSEVTDSFTGRPVLVKHKSFAYYHPAAFCIAQIIGDFPLLLVQVSIFSVIMYFLTDLTPTASAFFTFWIIILAISMCMTACFRAIGAAFSTFDGASKVSGLLFSVYITYSGYMIQKPDMHPWFVWMAWLDPMFYGLDGLLSNELKGKTIPCVGPNLVPSGQGYGDVSHQSCSGVPGATPGDTVLTGDQYLEALSYGRSHIWRNLGIIWAWWALFVVITIVATSRWRSSSEGGTTLLIPRERSKGGYMQQQQQHPQGPSGDIEAQVEEFAINEKSTETREDIVDKKDDADNGADGMSGNGDTDMVGSKSVFTWKKLTYTVKTPDGDRMLLDKVQGYVKPGMLGALMGSSGAGKTTLLDVLAQRKTDGTVEGSVLVDGRPLPVSFQRSAGYCEQLDVHESYATVREAFEFSALLRQSRDTPREEKLRYVDVIIDLLELHDLADTLIGKVGSGLTVEQRKRVTIGVELVAKPSILIFLDEPTSGLDGQSAFDITRFLRKLADAGQAVLVTIHQPSAQLFAQFDTLLLLAKGGKTVYFGDIGAEAQTVRDYFARHGAPCPAEANPAEHMIDVVSGHVLQGRDWNRVWLDSPEHAAVSAEIDRIVAEAAAKPPGTVDDGHEFATSLMTQTRIVTQRMNVSLFRNTDYAMNKFALHVFSALFNGFSFWMIGASVADLQSKLFTIFQFIFVAPGVLAQLQPLFIERRDIFEAREKKSKMYSWVAFVSALIVSEIPYLVVCAVLYFVCWYYTVGFPTDPARAGATFLVMLLYEFLYTGIGQFVAAYAPNAVFAALANPVLLGLLIFFCGVLVPYAQITPFWRYWLYYLNPFNYLMGSLLVFDVWGSDVTCAPRELARFDPPSNATTTCGAYLADYLAADGRAARLLNPEATSDCQVCPYRSGSDYLGTLNLDSYSNGWRDTAIVAGFVVSSYAMVYLLMKLRTKTSKKAE